MSKKIEFVKPILHIDKFFKVSDHLIRADDYELVQLGRAMRQAYENQMMETDEIDQIEEEVDEEAMAFQRNEAELEAEQEMMQNPAECKSGVCD